MYICDKDHKKMLTDRKSINFHAFDNNVIYSNFIYPSMLWQESCLLSLSHKIRQSQQLQWLSDCLVSQRLGIQILGWSIINIILISITYITALSSHVILKSHACLMLTAFIGQSTPLYTIPYILFSACICIFLQCDF